MKLVYSQLLAVLLRVETDRFDGGHNHHHTQRDGNKQHDHMLGSVFESQLLILVLLAVCDHLRGPCGGRLSVQLHLVTAGSRLSGPADLRPFIWLHRENHDKSQCVFYCVWYKRLGSVSLFCSARLHLFDQKCSKTLTLWNITVIQFKIAVFYLNVF